MTLEKCPLDAVDAETWDVADAVRLYVQHGLAPAAGGTLDQAASFVQAVELIGKMLSKAATET